MKKKTLHFLICSAGAFLTIVIASLFFILINKPLIVFYGLPDSVTKAIEQQAGTSFAFKVIDGTKPLSASKKELSRAFLVVLYDGKTAAKIGATAVSPDEKLFALMPSAVRESAKTNGKRYGVPVLFDHFGFDCNIPLLARKGLSTPKTLTELVKDATAMKGKNLWPIVCAGETDADLLQFTGALVISESGIAAYEDLVSAVSKGKAFPELIKTTALKKSLDTLVAWRKQGIIHPEWFRMKKADVSAFMQYDYACFFAISLSEHRAVDQKVIEKLGCIEFPTDRKEVNRGILAPSIVVIEQKHILPGHTSAQQFVNKLVQEEAQAALANATGLSPANANSAVPDKQADDARFWIASSQKPYPDPAADAFADPEDRTSFAAAIRQYLVADGAYE